MGPLVTFLVCLTTTEMYHFLSVGSDVASERVLLNFSLSGVLPHFSLSGPTTLASPCQFLVPHAECA